MYIYIYKDPTYIHVDMYKYMRILYIFIYVYIYIRIVWCSCPVVNRPLEPLLQCVVVCCSVLQRVAACCSVCCSVTNLPSSKRLHNFAEKLERRVEHLHLIRRRIFIARTQDLLPLAACVCVCGLYYVFACFDLCTICLFCVWGGYD